MYVSLACDCANETSFFFKDIISFSQLNVRLKPLQNVNYHVVKLTV